MMPAGDDANIKLEGSAAGAGNREESLTKGEVNEEAGEDGEDDETHDEARCHLQALPREDDEL